jgi:putative inorganic carbon (hco3(-)) transporter
MRDILLLSIVLPSCIAALRWPWVGVILWSWLSIMSPHRYTYGIAYSAPLAALAVGCTVLGLLWTRERASPFKGSPVTWLSVFMAWMTLSWLFGLNVEGDYEQWKKVMKVDGMLLVGLTLLHSRQHIMALVAVCAGSLAVLGAKGGVYTLLAGGGGRVWGPPGSFIADNNAFALALVMTIPLLRFLQLQMQSTRGRFALTVVMVLCAVSALGSQSRGALLAIVAMAATLWLRSADKLRIGIILIAAAVPIIAFMPAEWTARMGTMRTYEEDGSAMGRINAWWTAWNIALHYPLGVGFNAATQELTARFSPNAESVLVAHSIYFQILGNHGFIGLALFLGMLIATWRSAGWLRTYKSVVPGVKWSAELGAMCQVALAGYAVGGAFLNLAYFDLPYNIMAMVVLTRVWVENQRWKSEPLESPRWMVWLGLSQARKAA